MLLAATLEEVTDLIHFNSFAFFIPEYETTPDPSIDPTIKRTVIGKIMKQQQRYFSASKSNKPRNKTIVTFRAHKKFCVSFL